jgi:hypothetical protein
MVTGEKKVAVDKVDVGWVQRFFLFRDESFFVSESRVLLLLLCFIQFLGPIQTFFSST